MAINNNRDRQRTRVVYVPVNTGGGSGGGSQEKIKVEENGLKFSYSTFTEIPQIFDFSDLTDMSYMFSRCSYLTTIPEMDVSKVDLMDSMCRSCSSLTDLGGFIGLKCDLDLSSSSNLTHESLMNVINKAADVTTSPATLRLGRTNLAKLSDEEKAIATGKGWTLA